jgi:hypothetical protein
VLVRDATPRRRAVVSPPRSAQVEVGRDRSPDTPNPEMTTTSFARRLPFAAVLLLGACADAATAPTAVGAPRLAVVGENGARRFTQDELYDFGGDGVVQFTCEDGTQSEPVQLFGTLFERYTFTQTPSGGLHYLSSTMPVGLHGVGVVSGQEYRVVERAHSAAHYDEDDQGGGSLHETLILRARDTRETFGITYLVQWRFAGSGDMTVNRWKERETCRR